MDANRPIRSIRMVALAIACSAAFVQPGLAQTASADCEAVYRAQGNAQKAAVETIGNAEQSFKDKVSAARACLEAFGAAAARITILMGASDLASVQNMVAQAACSVIERKAGSVVGAATGAAGSAIGAAGSAIGTVADAVSTTPSPASNLVCAQTPNYRFEGFPDSPAAQIRRRAAEREAGCVPASTQNAPTAPRAPAAGGGFWQGLSKSILGG